MNYEYLLTTIILNKTIKLLIPVIVLTMKMNCIFHDTCRFCILQFNIVTTL